MELDISTLEAVLGIAVQTTIIVAAVYGLVVALIKKPLAEKIASVGKDHGKRIGIVEQNCVGQDKTINALQREQDLLQLQQSQFAQELGKLAGVLSRIDSSLMEAREDRHKDTRQLVERLAAIETRLKIFGELKEVLGQLTRKKE